MQAWLSDDVYRYLWDGGILANGVNPYAFTPDSPTLAAFRNADGASVYAQMDYRSVPTIYPPLAQYCFAVAIIASRFWGYSDWLAGYWAWKGLAVSAELVGLYIVWKTITQGENPARKRRQQKGFLAYCCLPLPIIEFAGQAHLDALLLPPLACLLFLIFRLFADNAPEGAPDDGKRRRFTRAVYAAAGAFCGALGAIKILPFALLAPLLRSAPARDFRAALLAGAVLAVTVACAPLLHSLDILGGFLRSASEVSQTLQFNGGAYYALCYACAAFGVAGYWLFMPALFAASRLPAILLAGFWRRAHSRKELLRLAAFTLAAATLWSPKVHTWYLAPLLFVNIVVGWKWLYALAAGSMLSYSYYAVSPAAEQYGIEMAVWAIAAALAVAEYRAEYHARKAFSRVAKMAQD